MTGGKFAPFVAVATILALGASLAGCSSPSSGGSSSAKTLTVYSGAAGQVVENYNPLGPTALNGVGGLIYEPLFYFNNRKGLTDKPTPVLGESSSFNKEGTVLSVTIKSGVKWSDGKPLTAADVAYTFNLISSTPALNHLGPLAPKAKALDDTHVELTFPAPAFVQGPAVLGMTYIVPEHIWKNIADPAKDRNLNPVGSGPMEASTFSPESYLFKKNPEFRDASQVEVPSIRTYALPGGDQAASNKFLAGQLDWGGFLVPDIDKVMANKKNMTYAPTIDGAVVINTCSSAALGCTGPQTDPVVRNAISAAIDRSEVNKLAFYGKASSISPTFVLPAAGSDKYISSKYPDMPMSPDTAKAVSLLQNDGWTKGSDGIFEKDGKRLSMSMLVATGSTAFIAAGNVMKQQLLRAGIDIQPTQLAQTAVLSNQSLGKFELSLQGGLFQGPVADPYYIYSQHFGGEGALPVGQPANPYNNFVRFSDPTVDKEVNIAAATEDPAKKATAYAAIQDVIVPQMPYIPVLNNPGFGEHNTTNYTGWPTAENNYASPAPWNAPDNGQVILHLKSVKSK